MQAIVTKYLPGTDTKGARIKATAEAGSVTIGYPHELRDGQPAHRAAAQALAAKFNWPDKYLGAALPNNGGYVFVAVHPWSEE
jgi:hypothetical protein